MLDPDYLERAGEMTASVYSQIEAEMLDVLTRKMIGGDISGQVSQTALVLLSQGSSGELLSVLNKYKGEIDDAVAEEVTKALRRSDNDDLSRIKRGMGVDLPSITTRQMAVTVAGIRDILARENLAMVQSAQTEFLNQATWAITQVNTGMMTTERALHVAVRNLERKGLTLVSYRNTETGRQTVRNKVDVAVRRHIRTQIHQASMRRTEQVLDDAGVELVEVSSHGGARPSHAKWQGKVYSRNGDKVIDGVRYRDFKTACNWGDVADGIGGANCRHSYAAWFPGMKRMYEHEPEHPSGLSNEEVYGLTQKQRAMERGVREAKRELRGAEQIYEKDPSLANQANAARAKLVLQDRQAKLRQLVKDNPKVLQRSPRREWAGDMPKVKIPAPMAKGVDSILSQPGFKKKIKSAGTTKQAVKNELREMLETDGLKMRDLGALGKKQSAKYLNQAIDNAKKSIGHNVGYSNDVKVIAGVTRGEPMSFERADGGSVNPNFNKGAKYWMNCQSCVVAFETRLRGFDLIAKPYKKGGVAERLALDANLAYIDPATGARPPMIFGDGANTPKRVLKFLEDNIEEGGRYELKYSLDAATGDGHIVCISRNADSELSIYDPQSGDIYEGASLRNHVKTFVLKGTVGGMKVEWPVQLLRVDNLDLNKLVIEEIVERAK